MFEEIHPVIYISVFTILVTLKLGLYDTVREYFYDKNNVTLENRKYILGEKDTNTFLKMYFDKYQSRKVCLFAYLMNLVICTLILIKNLS